MREHEATVSVEGNRHESSIKDFKKDDKVEFRHRNEYHEEARIGSKGTILSTEYSRTLGASAMVKWDNPKYMDSKMYFNQLGKI